MPLKHTVEEIVLKNGARGLLVDTPDATSVYYGVHFRAGTSYVEDKTKSQTAHIMEHLAFGANSKFETPEAFSREFNKNGAWSNALTSNTDMVYYGAAPYMEWERILDLQLLSIAEPRYSQEALNAEKGNVREEIAGYAANNGRVLWQEIMQAFGLQRWYDKAEIETITPVTLDDIKGHFDRTHTTNNMRFVIVGDLKQHRDTIINKFETVALEAGQQEEIAQEVAKAPDAVFIPRKDVPSLIFRLSFFINRELSLEERRTLAVVTHVLTGTFHSRIFGEARRRGICYGMGSSFDASNTGVSEFSVGAQVQFANAKELLDLVIEQLNDVRKHGITEDELKAAKEYRLGSMQMGYDTTYSLADWYSDEYYDNGVIDTPDDMVQRIEKTTVADTQKLVNEFIETAIWTLGGIGNSDSETFQQYYEQCKKGLIGA